MDRFKHTITKYLNNEKTHETNKKPLYKSLKTIDKDLYEAELFKSTLDTENT